MIKVYHNQSSNRHLEVKPDVLRQNFKDAVHVANVDTNDLEKAFELTNHIDGPWPSNPGVEVLTEHVRSTSVGDFMVLNDHTYAVDAFGFIKLS